MLLILIVLLISQDSSRMDHEYDHDPEQEKNFLFT